MERVRDGIQSNKELDGMSSRRVYDKIRKMINKESVSLESELKLSKHVNPCKISFNALTSMFKVKALLTKKCLQVQVLLHPAKGTAILPTRK